MDSQAIEKKEALESTVFKGACRVPTIGGIPMIPLIVMLLVFASIAMYHLWVIALIPVAWLVMFLLTKSDDRFFHVLWVMLRIRLRNLPHRDWSGFTYSPVEHDRRRPWARRRI